VHCWQALSLTCGCLLQRAQNLEQTCIQLNAMFVNPHNLDTWGKLDLTAPEVISDTQLWRLCEWLQRRLAGKCL
jgi:hypothetical protein